MTLASYLYSDWKFGEKGASGAIHTVPMLTGYKDLLAVVYSEVLRMEVYKITPDGHLVQTFAFDKDITSAIVDEANGKVFGYNRLDDFDKVYVFDFSVK